MEGEVLLGDGFEISGGSWGPTIGASAMGMRGLGGLLACLFAPSSTFGACAVVESDGWLLGRLWYRSRRSAQGWTRDSTWGRPRGSNWAGIGPGAGAGRSSGMRLGSASRSGGWTGSARGWATGWMGSGGGCTLSLGIRLGGLGTASGVTLRAGWESSGVTLRGGAGSGVGTSKGLGCGTRPVMSSERTWRVVTWLSVRGSVGEPMDGLRRASRMARMPARIKSFEDAIGIVTLLGNQARVSHSRVVLVSATHTS
jgi:hypothetical protein